MKYNILLRTGQDGFGEFLITLLTVDEINNYKSMNERDKHVLAKVTFTPINKEEARQHAHKIANYFEQVDTAKEAVIRCTKI